MSGAIERGVPNRAKQKGEERGKERGEMTPRAILLLFSCLIGPRFGSATRPLYVTLPRPFPISLSLSSPPLPFSRSSPPSVLPPLAHPFPPPSSYVPSLDSSTHRLPQSRRTFLTFLIRLIVCPLSIDGHPLFGPLSPSSFPSEQHPPFSSPNHHTASLSHPVPVLYCTHPQLTLLAFASPVCLPYATARGHVGASSPDVSHYCKFISVN